MELSAVIAIGGFAISVVTFFIGRISAGKSAGREDGQLISDIGYIKSSVNRLSDDIKEFRGALEAVRIEQAAHGRDIESAFRRIKTLEEKVSHYHEA